MFSKVCNMIDYQMLLVYSKKCVFVERNVAAIAFMLKKTVEKACYVTYVSRYECDIFLACTRASHSFRKNICHSL